MERHAGALLTDVVSRVALERLLTQARSRPRLPTREQIDGKQGRVVRGSRQGWKQAQGILRGAVRLVVQGGARDELRDDGSGGDRDRGRRGNGTRPRKLDDVLRRRRGRREGAREREEAWRQGAHARHQASRRDDRRVRGPRRSSRRALAAVTEGELNARGGEDRRSFGPLVPALPAPPGDSTRELRCDAPTGYFKSYSFCEFGGSRPPPIWPASSRSRRAPCTGTCRI